MVLINGLAHGLSKSKLKTLHRQINNIKNLTLLKFKKLDLHYRGTLRCFVNRAPERLRVPPCENHHALYFQTYCTAVEMLDDYMSACASLNSLPSISSSVVSSSLEQMLNTFTSISVTTATRESLFAVRT